MNDDEAVRAAQIARLDEGGVEAEATLSALKAQWAHEDAATQVARRHVLAAHEQGARDRAAMRAALAAVKPFTATVPETPQD